tara:strand:- start:1839 stop:3212 length:1374 start_codon:yes stop_codon:yes gene_type:complete
VRRLYLKIILAIWVVMIASSLGAGAIMRAVQDEISADRVRAFSVERFFLPGIASVLEEAEGKDQDALIKSFRRSWLVKGPAAFKLTDSDGTVLLQRGPGRLLEALDAPDRSHRAWQHEFTYSDRTYTIVALPMDRGRNDRGRRAPTLLPRDGMGLLLIIGIAIPISVLLSMLIARYLVRPLKSFEQAGMQLADGDLSARVNPKVSARGDELADFANTFDHMAEKIEHLVNSHKDLLRDVSHELRSPLARVHAAMSLARQRTGGAVDGEMDRIELELNRLDGLIGKLLTFARLDSRRVLLDKQPIEIDSVLADVIGDAAIEGEPDGKTIALTESSKLHVMGDAELLASCFENIIRNAIRHTPSGTTVAVSLQASDDGRRCVVEVRDHGPGIDEQHLETVFELFRKFDDKGGENTGSSGIGLAIAKKVVTLHEGDISATNAPDGGLIVTVSLPLEDVPA